jgi:hypothetical protein
MSKKSSAKGFGLPSKRHCVGHDCDGLRDLAEDMAVEGTGGGSAGKWCAQKRLDLPSSQKSAESQ